MAFTHKLVGLRWAPNRGKSTQEVEDNEWQNNHNNNRSHTPSNSYNTINTFERRNIPRQILTKCMLLINKGQSIQLCPPICNKESRHTIILDCTKLTVGFSFFTLPGIGIQLLIDTASYLFIRDELNFLTSSLNSFPSSINNNKIWWICGPRNGNFCGCCQL